MTKLNKSFLYLFPLLYRELIKELQLDYTSFIVNDWLITINNTFCYTDTPYQYAVQFKDTDKTNEIITILSKSTLFRGSDDNGSTFTILLEVPESVKDSYEFLINGKYSKFNESDKKDIIKFAVSFLVGSDGNERKQVQEILTGILYKTPQRIKVMADKYGVPVKDWHPDWELSTKININEETY